jgi:lipoate-protein ligase A
MFIVERPQTNPYFNLAAEEYLLKNLDEDCFMLWQNEPSVIIGKHQNALSEINLPLIQQNNIPVIRRISGGGTVYHDLGNLNFTFIKRGQVGRLVDFSQFLQPITEALNHMGVPARQEGKNDLRVDGLKISGNSEHVHRDRVLHHGTLLFNSNLELLSQILQGKSYTFKDKSVQSVRSKVANVAEFLINPVSIEEFGKRIKEHLIRKEKNVRFYSLTHSDVDKINGLVQTKYNTWKWNFGYSPNYLFENKCIYKNVEYNIALEVRDGVITHAEIDFTSMPFETNNALKNLLIGKNHNYDEIKLCILKLNRNKESLNFDPNILLELLF